MPGPVVIGYDQTPQSDRALAEAAREAAWRGTSLSVVGAYLWLRSPDLAASPVVTVPDTESEEDCRKVAEQAVGQAVDRVRSADPGLSVEAHVAAGQAAGVLAEAARGAELLVVGSRGRGGFPGLRVGSVSLRVLADACCPVIVVPGGDRAVRGRVAAAVDIDESCEDVMDFAFNEADRRGAELTVHHVWDEPWIGTYAPDVDVEAQVKETEEDCALRLDSIVRSWQSRFPDVRVAQRVAAGPAASVLVAAAEEADLIVLGGRRHGDGRRGMKIGPVATTVLQHAHCPVAIVPLG